MEMSGTTERRGTPHANEGQNDKDMRSSRMRKKETRNV
jgi:hypothetical protein